MLRGYATAREYLDDVIALASVMFQWRRHGAVTETEGELRALAELEIDITRREDVIAARTDATLPPLPFQIACKRLGLSKTEARVLSLLVALEVSAAADRPRATIGLLEQLIYRTRELRELSVVELAADSRLFAHRLAELGTDREVPWLATSVRTMPRVVELALGRLRLDFRVTRCATFVEQPPASDHLLLPEETREAVEDAIDSQLTGVAFLQSVPFLVGAEGSGRASLVYGAACRRAMPVVEVHAATLPRELGELDAMLRDIRREATLFGAVLLVRDVHMLAGEEGRGIPDLIPRVVEALTPHVGPLAMTATRACWPRTTLRPALTVEIGVPSEEERVVLFTRALDDAELAATAAARYRITGGLIERAVQAARGHAKARKQPLALDDLRAAVRNLLDSELSTLGRLVEWRQSWSDLVLPDDIREELRELISRVHHRRRVLDDWGFARKVGKGTGLSALFSGAPGTGKTMVAGLIAAELGLDLYQIDTSRLVSKWVGETEKNLARLFDAAAAGHAVLLFDEADSLFAKRTDVKSSNDRYANLEVNYLLQRMESFEGISILTTNLETSVDEAFRRRLAFRITFPLPEVEERERLWRAMLTSTASVAPGLDFKALAQRYEMSGGYIRNAVLRAAYLAAADGGTITQRHLQRAAVLEYTAMGKIVHHHSTL